MKIGSRDFRSSVRNFEYHPRRFDECRFGLAEFFPQHAADAVAKHGGSGLLANHKANAAFGNIVGVKSAHGEREFSQDATLHFDPPVCLRRTQSVRAQRVLLLGPVRIQ